MVAGVDIHEVLVFGYLSTCICIIYMYMCTYMHTCTHTCTCNSVCVYVYAYIYAHV